MQDLQYKSHSIDTHAMHKSSYWPVSKVGMQALGYDGYVDLSGMHFAPIVCANR